MGARAPLTRPGLAADGEAHGSAGPLEGRERAAPARRWGRGAGRGSRAFPAPGAGARPSEPDIRPALAPSLLRGEAGPTCDG